MGAQGCGRDAAVTTAPASNAMEQTSTAAFLLSTRGYVRIPNAVPTLTLETARTQFFEWLHDCFDTAVEEGVHAVSKRYGVHFWHDKGRFRISPKLTGAFADPMLIAHPQVSAVLSALLGSDFYCKYVGSDTCLGTAALQPPHRDVMFYRVNSPSCYVINIALVDCHLDNGPLEVWPNGTQWWGPQPFLNNRVLPFATEGHRPELERLLEACPAEKILLSAGDILLRDPGMLHRGTINRSGEPRPVLTLGVAKRSYDYRYGNIRFNLDETAYAALDERVRAMFTYAFEPSTLFYWRMRWRRLLAGPAPSRFA